MQAICSESVGLHPAAWRLAPDLHLFTTASLFTGTCRYRWRTAWAIPSPAVALEVRKCVLMWWTNGKFGTVTVIARVVPWPRDSPRPQLFSRCCAICPRSLFDLAGIRFRVGHGAHHWRWHVDAL